MVRDPGPYHRAGMRCSSGVTRRLGPDADPPARRAARFVTEAASNAGAAWQNVHDSLPPPPIRAMHKLHKRLLIIVLAVVAAAGCSLSTSPDVEVTHYGSGGRRLLFIGNSLTGFNDMPAMVTALAESAKVSPSPSADVDWLPDYALIDHWSDGQAQHLITAGHYDIVFLQQGPSSVELNRDTLRLAAKLFAPVIRAAGGVPALLSVWPASDRQVDFDRTTESYRLAAQDVGGFHAPGGETWRAAWRRNASLQFYSSDGLHPSALGSYAVALSIVGIIYDRSVVGLPATFRLANGRLFQVDASTARVVQEAADEANHQFGLQPVR
jgi:hypothetical protein